MGVDTRKPPLPAPTDPSTLSEATAESVTPTDLATDVSRRTDRTSYSVPEDGSPITLSTRKKRGDRKKENESTLTRASHHSQTSLLIEYFEGGKESKTIQSRPSVRVKVTPSAARKIKDANDHIQISETGKSRKPSYTRRISLGPNTAGEKLITESGDDKSLSSYASATEESNLTSRNPPIEIEVMHKDLGSPLSATSKDARYTYAHTSDISSMPPDSFLDGHEGNRTPRRRRSRSLTRDEVVTTKDTLKTPSRRRSRSLSRERITQKVIEKIVRPRETSGKHKHSKSRSRSASNEQVFEATKSPRRRSSKSHREEEFTSGAESSLLTTSQLSPSRKSGDQYSFRSGTSKSSINNPKLLETVEDAIRRLILPELTALKHEQSQHGRSKHEKGDRDSFVTASSASEDQTRRHVTKISSASDVAGKPKVVLNRSDQDPGVTLSGNSVKGRKERHGERRDSVSERSYDRDFSEGTVIRDDGKMDKKRSKERHGGRDAAAGATAGAILTAAALRSHDSKSSLDRRERRKKRSKSRSRSASIAESTEEAYHRGAIPSMPFSSDIHGSELTRDSILSERVDHSHEETHPSGFGTPLREVSRGSPREVHSPASRTPTRTPVQKGLGMHHSNLSRGDLSIHSAQSDRSIRNSGHHKALEAGLAGAGVGAGVAALVDEQNQHHHTLPEYEASLERSYAQRHQNRGLSPIQSVASYRDDITDPPNRDSFRHTHSTGSLSSLGHGGAEQRRNSEMSINSLSSARSTNFARSRRPHGINLEKSDANITQDRLPDSELLHDELLSKDAGIEQWYDQQHQENDRYRSSMDDDGFRDSTIDVRHMTNYTDDSLDGTYLDKVTEGQQVVGVGANPEYRHTPIAVESAVASLLDASMVDSSRSGKSKVGERAYADSITGGHPEAADYHEGSERGLTVSPSGSPLKQRHNARSLEARSRSGKSLRQGSVASPPRLGKGRSTDEREEDIPMGASGIPVADSPIPEIGHGFSDESDINTNPSIIQGPIGGVQHGSRDHWPYEPTPPQSNGNLLAENHARDGHQDLKAGELGLLGATVGAGLAAAGHHQASLDQEQHDREFQERYGKQATVEDDYGRGLDHDFGARPDSYMGGAEIPSPPYKEPKDEGYISAANARSPIGATPEPQEKRAHLFGDDGMAGIDDLMGGEDPFVSQNHARHLSGYSHGMPSPLYDSSTGKGIDRIQSKDVVALMDHLTVRDAQRNARDTEILVTLVRSAAEMRNSFEDMKRFIADQDKMIIDTTDKNTERSVQKVLQGPRPQPLGTPRGPRRTATEEEMIDDLPAKRRNVFRRALKGLSTRSSNDLAKIEDMLVQLLGEVEGLKAAQELRPNGTQPTSLNSYDNLRTVPEGYEPEGHAGTSSTTNQSGYFSNPPSRQTSGMRGYEGRRASDHRISTVVEGDEELVAQEQQSPNRRSYQDEPLLTPTQEVHRGGSVPLNTPPQAYVPTGAQSNEHTPRTEKNRKHKSNSSSIFPKISRWSETTASSVAKNFRNSGRKEKAQSEASRSGSDMNYYGDEHYDPQGDDRIRSTYSLDQDQRPGENRSPSPLIPQGMQEDPKYQAHRNSLLLQHPQPRPGPTHRYQHHLESQAQNYGSPMSPTSDQWGSNPSLVRFPTGAGNRHSGGAGNLSPISDGGYSEVSAAKQTSAPPRPPKVPDEPLVPQRPPKVRANDGKPQYTRSPLSSEHLAAGEQQRYSNASSGYEHVNGSPRSASGQVPRRGPSGPRPITSSGQYAPDRMDTVRKNRHRDTRTLGLRDDEDVTF
ncbi:MAG: hypothetical protein M1812_003709 [Candelaria pacifica]|nr:MAG: hypothetical protein M1812_003709 [Candelaria pacifica]